MNPMTTTNNMSLLAAPRVRTLQVPFLMGLMLVLSAFFLARQSHAAEPAGKLAAESARSYVVAPGDTLDRIIQKTMAQSPLKVELLREALAAANPQAIPNVRNPRLKAGAVLQLPDDDALLQAVVLPMLQPAGMASYATSNDADNRKRWVRYP